MAVILLLAVLAGYSIWAARRICLRKKRRGKACGSCPHRGAGRCP